MQEYATALCSYKFSKAAKTWQRSNDVQRVHESILKGNNTLYKVHVPYNEGMFKLSQCRQMLYTTEKESLIVLMHGLINAKGYIVNISPKV